MRRPAILRFERDTFMEDLAGQLAADPAALAGRIADARSYRARPPGEPGSWSPRTDGLKLYQPAQGHFNLVAASLVCRIPGMPDRTLDPGADEEVGFVLRRLVPIPGAATVEAAWVDDATGKGWRPVGVDGNRLLTGEELLPLFPVRFQDGGPRRLLAGLIPTAGADTFKGTGALAADPRSDADRASDPDPRIEAFDTRVTGPLGSLRDPDLEPAQQLRMEASRFILLDLAELLVNEIPDTWAAVAAGARPALDPAQALYDFLEGATVEGPGSASLRSALVTAWGQRLRTAGEAEPAPTLAYDLSHSTFATGEPPSGDATLRARFVAALPPRAASRSPAPASAAEAAADEVPRLFGRGARFLVRPVFRRPKCLPVPVVIVGDPSAPFAIASFFDSDAPARPVRIQLPVDTSIAELRKYPRNVAFAISDQLREQMGRVTDLKKTLDGELASGESFDIGMLCSFSIPIITICALIVLLIFVSLLNLVFWWMPFLRICFPILLPAKRP